MQTDERYLTLGEVDERLADNAAYGMDARSAYPAVKWHQRPVSWGWFLAAGVLVLLGILFAIGLTLHEAYDAQTAMGEHISPPPFNGLFETIHGWLAGWLWLPVRPDGWLW